MKKLLLLTSLLLPALMFAQSFTVTPYGLRALSDTSKTYIIIDSLNLDAKQLFDKSINFIKETYGNPDSTIKTTIDSEYIMFVGYRRGVSSASLKFITKMTYSIDVSYKVALKFRKGKIRFEVIGFDLPIQNYTVNYQEAYVNLVEQRSIVMGGVRGFYIWDKNLQLKNEKIKTDIENYFNAKINDLKKVVTSNDW